MPYKVKKIELAERGKKSIRWVEQHMPVIEKLKELFEEKKPFEGLTIGTALHTEATTAAFLRALIKGGAELAATGSNPLSTDDEVAAALADQGANIYAWRGETEEEYYKNLDRVLDHRPDLIIDDGADLITRAHSERPEILKDVIGGAEETTTGVTRLKALEKDGKLKIPVFAVNDTPAKSLFDNRFGTGESTINAIMSITNTLLAGKEVVVVGFGYVGRGIALRARGMGANVTVIEVDPIKALEANMMGFRTTNMNEAAKYGDIFITATGNIKVIRKEHLKKMKDGTILCNSGHFNVEIDLEGLDDLSETVEDIKEDVKEYKLKNGRRLHVLAEGRLVNLAGKKSLGHAAEIMDMSFGLQALVAEHLTKNRPSTIEVHKVPPEIDREVAKLKLKGMNVNIETPTKEQSEYKESWQLGT
ncbi:MAG: adenosylhomocysteinase [Candidatus Hadarchaeota archaeon]